MKPSHNEIQQSTIRKIEEVISHPKVQQLIKELNITRQEIIQHWPVIDHVKNNEGFNLQRNEQDGQLEMVALHDHIATQKRYQRRHPHLTTIRGEVTEVYQHPNGKKPFIVIMVQEPKKLDETRCVTFNDYLETAVTTGDQVEIRGRFSTYNGQTSYIFATENIQPCKKLKRKF